MCNSWLKRLFACSLTLCGTLVWADEPTSQPAPPPAPAADPAHSGCKPYDVRAAERLTGDWFGGRTWFEERGLTIDFNVASVYQHNARGGLRTHNAHDVSGGYGVDLHYFTEQAGLWPGGEIYAGVGGGWNNGVNRFVGSHFNVNNCAGGDNSGVVNELWYEQTLLSKKLRIRAGRISLGGCFATNAYANDAGIQFLNGALAGSGNIPMPANGFGIQFIARPVETFYFGAGVADANSDGRRVGVDTAFHGRDDFFSIYEFGFKPEFQTSWGSLPGQYRFGMWYDPQPNDVYADTWAGWRPAAPKRDDTGFYFNFDQALFREHPDAAGDEQGLGAFFHYSYAHADAHDIEHFWNAGVEYLGLIPTRDADELGLGVAQGLLSRKLVYTGIDPQRETVFEIYYRAHVFPWLEISPDLQWILRPGGVDTQDAFVAGVRVKITF